MTGSFTLRLCTKMFGLFKSLCKIEGFCECKKRIAFAISQAIRILNGQVSSGGLGAVAADEEDEFESEGGREMSARARLRGVKIAEEDEISSVLRVDRVGIGVFLLDVDFVGVFEVVVVVVVVVSPSSFSLVSSVTFTLVASTAEAVGSFVVVVAAVAFSAFGATSPLKLFVMLSLALSRFPLSQS